MIDFMREGVDIRETSHQLVCGDPSAVDDDYRLKKCDQVDGGSAN
jgi:hypothetical protein